MCVSHEGLLGSMWTLYAQANDRLDMLARAFPGDDVRFLVYVRDPASWSESVAAQALAVGDAEGARELASALAVARVFNWQSLMADISSRLGEERVIVREWAADLDVVLDFAVLFGLEVRPAFRKSAYWMNSRESRRNPLHFDRMRELKHVLRIPESASGVPSQDPNTCPDSAHNGCQNSPGTACGSTHFPCTAHASGSSGSGTRTSLIRPGIVGTYSWSTRWRNAAADPIGAFWRQLHYVSGRRSIARNLEHGPHDWHRS